jgi:tRNA(Ile)-lysidine synthase
MTMHSLEKQLLTHCQQKRFFKPDDKILLAVSGGMDSCVMFYLFLNIKDALGISIGIAHANHGLRDKHSDSDELFVESMAHRHSIRFHNKRLDVKNKAVREQRSLEEAARLARYEFLESVAHQHDYRIICTGHHMDDQAETVLSRVLKGSGWEGLSGIREAREGYVRPLLRISKALLHRYAEEKNILYIVDNSNSDLRFYRNKIRHQLLPLLQSDFDPQVTRHLYQLSVIAQETESFFAAQTPQWFSETARREGHKIILEIKPFNHYLLIQRKMILSLILKMLFENEPETKPTYHDYQAMLQLAESSQSGRRYLIGPLECVREHDRLIFGLSVNPAFADFDLPVQVGENYQWDNPSIRFSSHVLTDNRPGTLELGKHAGIEYIDQQKIQGQLVLRTWKTGDSFYPIGMNTSKKLSDFFTDQKIALSARNRIPILTDRSDNLERIIWICGYRLDNRYKIDSNTQRIIKLECHRHETNLKN